MNLSHAFIKTILLGSLCTGGLAHAHCDPISGDDYFDTVNPLVLPQPGSDDFNGPLVPGPNLGPNGILDSDEFALLADAVGSHSSPLHEDGCAAFQANYAQATIDLPAGYRETVAAYFTLGDTDSVTAMVAFFAFFLIELDPADYDLSQATFLGPNGDADGDGLTNKQEYDAIPGTGGPGSAKRTQYLMDAQTPASSEGETEGMDEGEHGEITILGGGFIEAGTNMTLSLQGVHHANGYQWQKNGVDLSGETGATLERHPVFEADEGTYRCRVDLEHKHAVYSEPAWVTVLPPGSLPVGSTAGLGALAAALAGVGLLRTRRK